MNRAKRGLGVNFFRGYGGPFFIRGGGVRNVRGFCGIPQTVHAFSLSITRPSPFRLLIDHNCSILHAFHGRGQIFTANADRQKFSHRSCNNAHDASPLPCVCYTTLCRPVPHVDNDIHMVLTLFLSPAYQPLQVHPPLRHRVIGYAVMIPAIWALQGLLCPAVAKAWLLRVADRERTG